MHSTPSNAVYASSSLLHTLRERFRDYFGARRFGDRGMWLGSIVGCLYCCMFGFCFGGLVGGFGFGCGDLVEVFGFGWLALRCPFYIELG